MMSKKYSIAEFSKYLDERRNVCEPKLEIPKEKLYYRENLGNIIDFWDYLSTKSIDSKNVNDIYKSIKEDIRELDLIIFKKIIFVLQQTNAFELEELDYKLDYDLFEGVITEEERNKMMNDFKGLDFDVLGINYEYNRGFCNDRSLGIYNVYKHMYEYKCYNMNDEDKVFILDIFNEYDVILRYIFEVHKNVTNLEYIDAIKEFEDLCKKDII